MLHRGNMLLQDTGMQSKTNEMAIGRKAHGIKFLQQQAGQPSSTGGAQKACGSVCTQVSTEHSCRSGEQSGRRSSGKGNRMIGKTALHAEQVQCIMCCKLDGAVHISDTMRAILSTARGMLQHKKKSTSNCQFPNNGRLCRQGHCDLQLQPCNSSICSCVCKF